MEQKNLFLLLKSALWYGDLYVGIGSDATYLALVVKDSLKFAENHDEVIHLQIRRA